MNVDIDFQDSQDINAALFLLVPLLEEVGVGLEFFLRLFRKAGSNACIARTSRDSAPVIGQAEKIINGYVEVGGDGDQDLLARLTSSALVETDGAVLDTDDGAEGLLRDSPGYAQFLNPILHLTLHPHCNFAACKVSHALQIANRA